MGWRSHATARRWPRAPPTGRSSYGTSRPASAGRRCRSRRPSFTRWSSLLMGRAYWQPASIDRFACGISSGARRGSSVATFGHDAPIVRLAVSADGAMLASSAEDRTVKLWTLDTLAPRRRLPARLTGCRPSPSVRTRNGSRWGGTTVRSDSGTSELGSWAPCSARRRPSRRRRPPHLCVTRA